MAALPAGGVTSTTLEDLLLEVVQRIAALQSTAATNPQNRTMITQFSQNALTGTYTIGLTIPATLTLGPSGVTSNATELFT